ncbi:MAG TPA: tripartite tricarboxylate transporter substrate binding protein [Xanthobacteraceae bacterium]|nr:tripartite tricarboxylate transporter substrate binding protein [Xanthobacteraceae bacterium]
MYAMMSRFFLTALALMIAVGGAGAQGASGAQWPTKPVKLIVPFPAGSSTDVVARIVAQSLGQRLGQGVVVEDRVGASGMLGVEYVAHAAPDGYTIGLVTTSTQALAPSLSAHLPYNPQKDFAPVSMIGSAPYVMVTFPGLGAKTVADFTALAKAQPGKLTYGSAGPGSLAHLAAVLYANTVGVNIVHVPYKSTSQSVTDLMAGRVDMQFATIPPTLPLIRSGQMQALATTGAKRNAALPDLPTVAETGLPGYEAVLWMAIETPAAVPPPVVAQLNRALTAVLAEPKVKAALLAQGVNAEPGTPEALRSRIAGDIERWRAVIAKAGLKPE